MTCQNFIDKYKTSNHSTPQQNCRYEHTYKTAHDAKTVEIHINPIINNTIYFTAS